MLGLEKILGAIDDVVMLNRKRNEEEERRTRAGSRKNKEKVHVGEDVKAKKKRQT